MITKTQACDQSVLNGPNGLNDIQFFRGCEEGCKYDPFLPANKLPMSEVLKMAKIGRIDLSLMNSFYWHAPNLLAESLTLKDLEANLYMIDYLCNLCPSIIDHSNDFFSRKIMQSMLYQNDKHELPINCLLRQGAVLSEV